MMQQPTPGLEPWQVEEPQSIPPHSGPLSWFGRQVPGSYVNPDTNETIVGKLLLLRVDHGHGRLYGVLSPYDLRRFAAWLSEQAAAAEANITIATEVPTSWPPGILPPNGRP
jgi:hypothetical protein